MDVKTGSFPFPDPLRKSSLSQLEAAEASARLADGSVATEAKATFLTSLAKRGETTAELTAFAAAFRSMARNPGLERWAGGAIDVVGTGGDRTGSFNISSAASMVVAACGVPVIKHGNRAVTSRSGSADFLEACGLPTQPPVESLPEILHELSWVFLFAPAFHPAFKEIAPVRRTLAGQGVRTIFNLLGPLINPAQPAHQVLGVYAREWLEPMAGAMHDLGLRRALAVHGRLSPVGSGIDELTSAGENFLAGAGELKGPVTVWEPESFGLECCQPEVLRGGTAAENAGLWAEVVDGRAPRGTIETVAWSAGAALWVAGAVPDPRTGLQLALERLRSGQVRSWWERARSFAADRGMVRQV